MIKKKRFFIGPPEKMHKEFERFNNRLGKMESGVGTGLVIHKAIIKKLKLENRLPKTRARDIIVGSKMLADMTAWRMGEIKERPNWSKLYTEAIEMFIKFVPESERRKVWKEIITEHIKSRKYFKS